MKEVLHPKYKVKKVLYPRFKVKEVLHPRFKVKDVLHPRFKVKDVLHPRFKVKDVLPSRVTKSVSLSKGEALVTSSLRMMAKLYMSPSFVPVSGASPLRISGAFHRHSAHSGNEL